MKHTPWSDYEKDLEYRDVARERAIGCVVFAAVITLASMMACSNTAAPTLATGTEPESANYRAVIEALASSDSAGTWADMHRYRGPLPMELDPFAGGWNMWFGMPPRRQD